MASPLAAFAVAQDFKDMLCVQVATSSVPFSRKSRQFIWSIALLSILFAGCASTDSLTPDSSLTHPQYPATLVKLPPVEVPAGQEITTVSLDTPTTSSSATDIPLLSFTELDASELTSIKRGEGSHVFSRMLADQKNFYATDSLTLLAGGFVVGGMMANTSLDNDIQQHFQSSVFGATSDDWFESLHASKELGNGLYTLPVFASTWAVSAVFPESQSAELAGIWGERCGALWWALLL
jgi:hypothetical protein